MLLSLQNKKIRCQIATEKVLHFYVNHFLWLNKWHLTTGDLPVETALYIYVYRKINSFLSLTEPTNKYKFIKIIAIYIIELVRGDGF